MEEDYKRILDRHRDKFRQAVSIDRLSSSLLVSHILSDGDWQTIENETASHRVDRLLDILKTKGYDKFKRFCVILETTYPYMLNCMFLGMEPPKNMFSGSARISKNSSKHSEREKESHQLWSKQGNVHRSVSMTEHDSCKETTLLKTELKVIQRKYDNVVQKLQKMEQEQSTGELILVDDEGKNHDEGFENEPMSLRAFDEEKERECEMIKQKYEDVLKELEIHRRQSEDLAAKCNNQLMESEHYRSLHLVGLNKCDQLVREAQMLNQKLNESENERAKLQQDYEEIILLREQEKKEMNELRGKRGIIWHQEPNTEKLAKEQETLKTMNDQLRMEFQLNLDKYQRLEERFTELREQLETVSKELDTTKNERAYWKQQYSVTKRSYEKCMQEKEAVLKQHDQALALQLKATRELTKLKEERNSALSEYSLVMSERDGVHKEMDKLQEDLSQAQEERAKMKTQIERVFQEKEAVSRDLAIVNSERDRAMKELYVVKQEMKRLESYKEELIKDRERAREDCEMFKEERDAARRERHEAIIHRDKILRECFEARQRNETFKGDGKESENLRKQFDALSKELANALSEAEVSKKRRDWSFSERDKMVKERDAIKVTCDVLRQERDRAVSDLAALLRDTDQIRREQNKSMEELKSLRAKIENSLEINAREGLVTSIDSAIDTDPGTDWEIELVALEKGSMKDDLGFDIATSKSSIVVTNVAKGSLADGKLRVNDCLLRVNDMDVSSVKYEKAVEAINEGDSLNLTVKRRKLSRGNKSYSPPIHLNISRGKELGILIDCNKSITWIKPGSVADHDDRLCVGDKIINVNSCAVNTLSQTETEDLLSSNALVLIVQKKNKKPRPNLFESLLVEVDEKIKKDSNIRQKAEYREAMLADSLSALQGSEKPSEISSAVQSEVDEDTSLNDNSSLFVRNQILNMSPSLTPLYEDKERTQGTQTELGSVVASSAIDDVQRRCMSISERSDGVRSTSSFGPSPPPRAMSVGVASTYVRYRSGRHTTLPTGVGSGPLETTTIDQVTSLDFGTRFPNRKKAVRPKSAPVVRPDHLEMIMDSKRVVHSGDSTLPRKTITHPPISPSDPLSLSARVNHITGGPQPISPPAFSSLFKTRNLPHFTVHSRPLLPGPAVSEYCMPTSCSTNNTSRSSLPEDGDPMKPSDVRSRTWTEPPKNFRNRQEVIKASIASPKLSKTTKNSGHSSWPRRQRIRSSSSQTQSFNIVDTHSSISSHSSCGRSTGSVGSSSGRNTPHVTPSTPTFHRDVIDHGPIIHINQHHLEGGEKQEKVRKLHIEKSSFPLGIQIAQGSTAGIFVTSVTEGSIAQKAGLRYGDQILEFNGINFRSANYSQAAMILGQSGSSVRLMVQYNPQKLKENATDNVTSYNSSEASITLGDSDVTPPVRKRFVPTNDVEAPGEPRYITTDKTVQSLGMKVVGGNATGLFVSEVQSAGYDCGVRVGDQVLEFNGVDFTSLTLEQATLELCKPSEKITMRVQYNPARYNVIKDRTGDSLYVRAMFDHAVSGKDQLSFKKDDILYITDTLYNGHMGCWKAWVINKEDAQQRESGMIPSRMKADQIVLLRLSIAPGDQEHSKLAGRRSFFRRSKKGSHSYTVTHSRESSDSAASISTFTDAGVASYQTVERLDIHHPRPVIILGPLSNIVSKKLALEAPYKFTLCHQQLVSASEMEIKKAVAEGVYLDYVTKENQYFVTFMATVTEEMEKVRHSILEVSPLAIEKLRAHRVYPIILFLKFKSPKHIKEQRDGKYLQQKLTTKEARSLHESSVRIEHEFRSEFSAVIPGGSINNLFSQIQDIVDDQQKKTLWITIPSNS